jgi:hypothetical protein
MDNDELRVSISGVITRLREEVVAGYEIIRAALEEVGVTVDNKGPISTGESTDQILEYVVKIATDPGVHTFVGTGTALAAKSALASGRQRGSKGGH